MPKVRVRPHSRRIARRSLREESRRARAEEKPALPPSVLNVAVDEAHDILQTQHAVFFSQMTRKDAVQISEELFRRYGMRTDVWADYGMPVARPQTELEAKFMREQGFEVGKRYPQWGLHRADHEHLDISR